MGGGRARGFSAPIPISLSTLEVVLSVLTNSLGMYDIGH